MLFKFLAATVSVAIFTASLAHAQSISQLGGPANLPPADFTGQQFVDNNGCVFLRAGFGGTVNWVPRVKADRRPLCSLPPSFGAAVAAAVEADMAPEATVAVAPPPIRTAAQPRRSGMGRLFGTSYVGDPIPLVPVTPPTPQITATSVIAAPTAPGGPAYVSTANGGSAQCVQASPQLETVVLRGGGTAEVCTRGDGTLTGWRSPQYAPGVIGGALTPFMMQGARLVTQGAVQLTNALPTPPKGYRLAWKDDRLNPLRGVGTALGQAQQDQVWTRDIPATEIVVAPAVAPPRIALSTMSAPDTQNATQSGASYVQIGTFGQPANAEAAKARLTALGLPVSMRNITIKGRVLQVVYAGPFANLAQSQAALATTRSAGFRDAILK